MGKRLKELLSALLSKSSDTIDLNVLTEHIFCLCHCKMLLAFSVE